MFLEVLGGEALQENDDSDKPRSHRMVANLQALCSKWGIEPQYFGYDATGAGVAFRDVVVSEWSMLPKEVMFGEKASSRYAGVSDQRSSYDVYANRVSELWSRARDCCARTTLGGYLYESLIRCVVGDTTPRPGAVKARR